MDLVPFGSNFFTMPRSVNRAKQPLTFLMIPNAIPVLLKLHSHEELPVDRCAQLTMRAPTIWDDGGFSSCVSVSLYKSKLDGNSLSYKVTINTDKLRGLQKNLDFLETLAAVNGYLNFNVRKCATHTGPNWDLETDDEEYGDETFKVMAEVLIPLSQSVENYCKYLYKRLYRSTDPQIFRCNISSAVFSKNVVRQLFILQLRRNSSVQLPTTNSLRVMRQVSNAINQNMPGCVRVTKVVTTAYCKTAFIFLQFVKQIEYNGDDENWRITNGCEELNSNRDNNAFTTNQYENCNITDRPRRQNDSVIYSVVIQTVVSKTKGCYDVLSEEELALNVEAQFNSRTVRCISYNVNHYQAINDEQYTANVYGPFNNSLCFLFQFYEESTYRQLFDACSVRRWKNATNLERFPALYRLRLKQPIFLADLPVYNKWLSRILTMLNRAQCDCKYNGYVGRINNVMQMFEK